MYSICFQNDPSSFLVKYVLCIKASTNIAHAATDIAGGCYDHGNAISGEDFPDGYTRISFDASADLCPEA